MAAINGRLSTVELLLYLGADLPVAELLHAVEATGAKALAVGIVILDAAEANAVVREIRRELSDEVELWVGGSGTAKFEPPPGVEKIDSMQRLEHRVEVLRIRVGAP